MASCPNCGTARRASDRYCPSCGMDLVGALRPPDPPEPMVGTTIAGKFLIKELIGSGGMGKVYRADQKGVGRMVAVKIMHRHLLGDQTAAARFTNEARASARLNHPHSISVLDFGQTENGVLYIVMEFLRGRPLDLVLRDDYPLSFGRIAYLMCQAMDAVHAAHNLQIIHRDLKPENIFLLDRKSDLDFVKVLDFGIAKMLDLEDRSVTTPGLVPGTPEYMSPEQARGEKLDPRSDVYSLGVIFYELLTRTVPFRGNSAVATMMAHVQDPPDPPSKRAPERNIPAALEAIVLWALAKDSDDRITSAKHFRDVVSAWAQVAGVWPEDDPRASSPEVLLDYFSPTQVSEFHQQVPAGGERPATRSDVDLSVPRPRPAASLIGRNSELVQVSKIIERRGPRCLRISGGSGSGKTALAQAAAELAEELGMAVFTVKPDRGWAGEMLAPATRIARYCLQLEEDKGGSSESADGNTDAEKLLTAASVAGVAPTAIPGLKELFGVPAHLAELDPDARRRERASAFRDLVEAAARRQPFVLIVEEIDRFDVSSRELVASLAASARGEVAVIITHDRDLSLLWPPEVEHIELSSLSEADSGALLDALFPKALPPDVKDKVLAAAGGHPLYMEQLAFALHYDPIDDPPERVADLIAARLDRLEQAERRVLQVMSVLRDVATRRELARISGHSVDEKLLTSLRERAFLRSEGDGLLFKHDLTARVVYSSIPAEVRRELHQAVAQALRARGASAASIAYHAFHADDGPRAVEELDRAGTWAARCLEFHGAVRYYTQALELVRREWGRGRMDPFELDRIAVDLARRLAAVLRRTGDLVAAEGVLEETLSVAAGREGARATLRLELGRLDLDRSNLARARRHLELASTDAESAGSDWLRGEVVRELARVRGLDGERDEAGKLLHRSLELSKRAAGQADASWQTLLDAAKIARQIGYGDRARGYLLDALQQAEGERSSLGKLQVSRMMAELAQRAKEWSEAELRLAQSVELAAQVGDRTSQASLLIDLGRVRRIGGDVEGARERLEHAVRVCREIGWWQGIKRAEQETEMLRYAAPQAL
ncbi:MAG: protein kinase [Myxococcales bacterium]|nr:protein kinase [Myxococcales bacterium]